MPRRGSGSRGRERENRSGEQNRIKRTTRRNMEHLNKMEEQLKVKDADCFVYVCVRERKREREREREKTNREVEITAIRACRKRVMGPGNCQESYWNQKTVSGVSPVF